MPVDDFAQPLIQAIDCGVAFAPGSAVLEGVDLAIASGEFVSIVGPSGCGKSTFLRIVAGLVAPSSGEVLVSGSRPEKARRGAAPMAFVFQDPTLLPWRTVADNLQLPGELQSSLPRLAPPDVLALLERVGLKPDDARKRPRELSGGMRMRVSLARAMATNPKLLLLDEPFAALDDVLRQQLNEELTRLWQADGWTGLFVTHNVSEAVFLSQRVLVMSSRPGRFVADVRVPFAYPRSFALRGDPEFARVTAEIGHVLREVLR